ncbi:MAG: hypothetical protein AB2693_34650 [Candidatus Thiodiazotropha sp.]
MSDQESGVIFPEEQEETISQPDSDMMTDDNGEETDYGSDWAPTDFEGSDDEDCSFTQEELEEAYAAREFFCQEYYVMNEVFESDSEEDVSNVYSLEE